MRFSFALCMVFILISSCNNSRDNEKKSSVSIDDSIATDNFVLDSIAFPLDFRDKPKHYPAFILWPGGYHSDEVTQEMTKTNWLGLYYRDGIYHLDSVDVKFQREFDPIEDIDTNDKSGWAVIPSDTSTIILLSGIELPTPSKIDTIGEIMNRTIQPNEHIRFHYAGNQYSVYAVAQKRKMGHGEVFVNYKLYIQQDDNPRQLIVAHPYFSDDAAYAYVLFAGDIDGDSIPDLIMETSYDYNILIPVLYLSSHAEEGKLLKVAGLHVSYGC